MRESKFKPFRPVVADFATVAEGDLLSFRRVLAGDWINPAYVFLTSEQAINMGEKYFIRKRRVDAVLKRRYEHGPEGDEVLEEISERGTHLAVLREDFDKAKAAHAKGDESAGINWLLAAREKMRTIDSSEGPFNNWVSGFDSAMMSVYHLAYKKTVKAQGRPCTP